MIEEKKCQNCGITFVRKPKICISEWAKQKFCSRKCANEGKKGIKANNALDIYYQTHEKDLSGLKKFNKEKGSWNKGLSWSETIKKKMSDVKKGITFNTGRTHFKKGMIPWNYKGLTPENRRIRSSIEYELWRNSVFARDGYTCQKTGIKGGDLVAHHIQGFSQFPELRLAINNGITLSKKSHLQFHKIYGFTKNTKEQLLEFLNN